MFVSDRGTRATNFFGHGLVALIEVSVRYSSSLSLRHASCHCLHSPNSNRYNRRNNRPSGPSCPACSLNDNLGAPAGYPHSALARSSRRNDLLPLFAYIGYSLGAYRLRLRGVRRQHDRLDQLQLGSGRGLNSAACASVAARPCAPALELVNGVRSRGLHWAVKNVRSTLPFSPIRQKSTVPKPIFHGEQFVRSAPS